MYAATINSKMGYVFKKDQNSHDGGFGGLEVWVDN